MQTIPIGYDRKGNMSVRPEFLVQKNISSTCAVTFAIFLDSFTVKLIVSNRGVVLNFKQGRRLKTEFERPRPFRARLAIDRGSRHPYVQQKTT